MKTSGALLRFVRGGDVIDLRFNHFVFAVENDIDRLYNR